MDCADPQVITELQHMGYVLFVALVIAVIAAFVFAGDEKEAKP